MKNIYEIKITFETDLELTSEELDHLVFAAEVQIEDPADHLGESKRARFATRNINTEYGKQTNQPNKKEKK